MLQFDKENDSAWESPQQHSKRATSTPSPSGFSDDELDYDALDRSMDSVSPDDTDSDSGACESAHVRGASERAPVDVRLLLRGVALERVLLPLHLTAQSIRVSMVLGERGVRRDTTTMLCGSNPPPWLRWDDATGVPSCTVQVGAGSPTLPLRVSVIIVDEEGREHEACCGQASLSVPSTATFSRSVCVRLCDDCGLFAGSFHVTLVASDDTDECALGEAASVGEVDVAAAAVAKATTPSPAFDDYASDAFESDTESGSAQRDASDVEVSAAFVVVLDAGVVGHVCVYLHCAFTSNGCVAVVRSAARYGHSCCRRQQGSHLTPRYTSIARSAASLSTWHHAQSRAVVDVDVGDESEATGDRTGIVDDAAVNAAAERIAGVTAAATAVVAAVCCASSDAAESRARHAGAATTADAAAATDTAATARRRRVAGEATTEQATRAAAAARPTARAGGRRLGRETLRSGVERPRRPRLPRHHA